MQAFRSISNLLKAYKKGVSKPFYLLLPFFLLISQFSNAQSALVEELKSELIVASFDSVKVYLLNELSFQLRESNPEKSESYARNALSLARQINDKKQEAKAMFHIGNLLF